MAQKMALVPEQYLLPRRMQISEESRTEDEIESLLNTNHMADDVKVKILNNMVSKYKRLVHTPYEPVKVSIEKSSDESKEEAIPISNSAELVDEDPMVQQILLSIPQTTRKFVPALIDKMKQANLFWNKQGQLIINGDLLPGSHVIDIFSFMLRNRKNINWPPGFNLFFQELIKTGIPLEWIQNEVLKRSFAHTSPIQIRGKSLVTLSKKTSPEGHVSSVNFPEGYFTPSRESKFKKKEHKLVSRRERSRSHEPAGAQWSNY